MRNKVALFVGTTLFVLLFAKCDNKNTPQIVDLWGDRIPSDNELVEPEDLIGGGYLATNVAIPQLYIYKPKGEGNGKAIVICPGGGYAALSIGHEGNVFAEWLASIGITGIVLKYRLPNSHKEIPMLDVHQAMRYVRGNANELGVDPNRIGIAGFSAGGHIASLATTRFDMDGISTRPDFSIFYYPVITMKEEYTHKDTRMQLLGDSLINEDLDYFSNELHVTTNTPPAILFLSDNDDQVDPMNSSLYYTALKNNNISASMHVFPKGGHGWGMSPEHMEFRYYNEMLGLLERWLEDK